MKKSIYLIASLTFLVSCIGTKEVYDDTYEAANAPYSKHVENDDLGYQDYIKNQESQYEVIVDSNSIENIDNQNEGDTYIYYGDVTNYNNTGFNNGGSFGNFGYSSGCYMNCWNYSYFGYCSHTHGYSCHHHYHNHSNYWGYNQWNYGCGFGNNWGYNNYYGSYYGWSGYYGWNNWQYPYYSTPYNTPNYYGGSSGGEVTSGGNHFYGHRGVASTGSSNTTLFPHTIKNTDGNTNSPFPSYSSNIDQKESNISKIEPSENINNTLLDQRDKPLYIESPENAMNDYNDSELNKPFTSNSSESDPVYSYQSTNNNSTKTSPSFNNRPATNVFDTNKNNSVGNNSGSNANTGGNDYSNQNTNSYQNKPENNQGNKYTPTNTNNSSSNRSDQNGRSSTTNSGSSGSNNSGSTYTGNRRSGSSTNGSSTNGSSNRGTTTSGNRGGGSNRSGSSGGTRSSSSGSSSGGSGSSGSSGSRRR